MWQRLKQFIGESIDLTTGQPLGNFAVGFIPLDLGSLREIATNEIGNTAADAGVLSSDSTPALIRVNLATDKAARVLWVATNVDEVTFPPIPKPPDMDTSQPFTIHLMAYMESTNDTPTIDVQVFDGVGDTEMGGPTAALDDSLAELTVTVVAANVAAPPGFINISLVPGAHGTDDLYLNAAWIEYVRKAA
jgi:hypothetical protein